MVFLAIYHSACQNSLMGLIEKRLVSIKNGHQVQIRSVVGGDAPAILALAKKILQTSDYLETDPDEFQVSVESEKQWIQTLTDDEGSLLLVAEHDHQAVALLDISRRNKLKLSHSGQLGMGIHKNWRGIGLGQAMLDIALKWAEDQSPLHRLQLHVMSGNRAALGLYGKLNFVEEGVQRKAIRQKNGTFSDLILMCRLLK